MRLFAIVWGALSLSLSANVMAQGSASLELVQLNACRSINSFLLMRGEGVQDADVATFEQDLQGLTASFEHLPPDQHSALAPSYQYLLSVLAEGRRYGPHEDDMPWRYPSELGQALLTFLEAADQRSAELSDPLLHTALKLEFLALQYSALAYFGYLDVNPLRGERYVNQNETVLLPELDAEMAHALPLMEQRQPQQASRLQANWSYVRAALGDFNSGKSGRVGNSGKPLAPLVTSRHARYLTEQLQRMAAP